MFAEKAPSNAPEWSVSDLPAPSSARSRTRSASCACAGEVSGYRGPHSSGHVYFCLKDQSARIDAVIWKSTFSRLRIKPQEGLEVIATGRITTFPGKSTYQIVVESLEPAGIGASWRCSRSAGASSRPRGCSTPRASGRCPICRGRSAS